MSVDNRISGKSYSERGKWQAGAFGTRYYAIVYAIEATGAGRIKFGRTLDVAKRLSSLSTASPVPLRLLGHIWLPDDAEADIHGHLRDYRSHGEWFIATKEVMEVASLIEQKKARALAELIGILGFLSDKMS